MNKYILQSLLLLFPRVTEYVIVDLVRRGHLSIPAVRQIPSLRNSLVYWSNHYSLSFSPSQSNIVKLPFRRKKAPPPNWERGYLPVASIKPLSERFLAVWAIENQDDHKEECVQWWCSKAVKVVFGMIVSSVTAETASDSVIQVGNPAGIKCQMFSCCRQIWCLECECECCPVSLFIVMSHWLSWMQGRSLSLCLWRWSDLLTPSLNFSLRTNQYI